MQPERGSAHGWLTAGGRRLEWASWGDGAGPVIVLLHEGLGCTALWRDFPKRLAQATGHRVFAWSRAGYGQSDPADLPRPVDYMTREAVDCLPQVLAATGGEQFILVGHSDGATIAAEYAGRVADHRVRGLVLMAPHFFTEPGGLAEIEAAGLAYDTGDLRDRLAKYHRDPDNAFRGWNDAWRNPAFASWDVADVIDYLRIPALVIQGRDDRYGTLAQVEVVRERSYAPVDTLVLDRCGHAPHLEQPDQTLDAVADFVTRLCRIEAAPVRVA